MPGIDSNTLLCLHFEGDDEQATFDDSSSSGHVVSASGSARIDRDDKHFGVSSLGLWGDGGFASVAASDDFDFAAGDWTIDFWAKIDSGVPRFFSWYSGEGNRLEFGWSATLGTQHKCKVSHVVDGSTSFELEFTSHQTLTGWKHYAVERSGTTLTLYLDGVSVASTSVASTLDVDVQLWALRIGYAGGWTFDGWIDEFRVSGVARYSGSGFTPETSAYTPAWVQSYRGLSDVRRTCVSSSRGRCDVVRSMRAASLRGTAHVLRTFEGSARGAAAVYGTHEASITGRHDVVVGLWSASMRGRHVVRNTFEAAILGLHDIMTVHVSSGRGLHLVNHAHVSSARGTHDVRRDYLGSLRGSHDVLGAAEYRLYRGAGQLPDFDAAPYETFSTLPHDTAALADGEWWFVLRHVNTRGLESKNVAAWRVIVDSGASTLAAPRTPVSIEATPVKVSGTNKVRVRAVYEAFLDAPTVRANEWAIWCLGGDPTAADPVRGVSTLTSVAMVVRGNVAYLDTTVSPQAIGTPTQVKVDVAACRQGSPDVYSPASLVTIPVNWSAPSETFFFGGA